MAASFWRKQQETADQDANDLRECSRIPESLATTLQQQQQHQRSPAESYRKANQNEEENGGDEERPRQNRLTSVRNPAILDALDSLHRSLLFSNLKFDTAEQQKTLDAGCLSQDIEKEQPVAGQLGIVHPSWPLEPTTIAKVNIAQGTIATASHRSTDAPETKGSEWSGYRISNSGDTDDNIVDCEQESLSDGGPDPNNNTSGNRVKMMVQKYDKGKVGARAVVCASDHHPDAHCIVKVNPGDRLRSSVGFEGETSDFESASVTSGSSMAADDVGRRSVRTSSAFSEGSRDVASIDRFDMGMVEQAGIDARNAPAAVAAAGHSTKITININCRCDTDPRRTSKATAGGVEEANKENVHMNRCSGAHHAQPPKLSRTEFEKTQSSNQQHKSNERKQALTKASPTYPQDGVEDETENEELMVLENEGVDSSEGGFDVMDQEEPNDEALHIDHHRYSAGSGRHCRSPEDEEYLDCDELRNDSTLSFYEEATSHPVTPQDPAKQSSTTESHKEPEDDDKPMISIVQELTEDQREVMSTITLNKAQIKAMQEYNDKLATTKPKPDEEEKPEKRRKSHEGNKKRHGKVNFNRQQRIMDDNFCNEVLDSAIHFDRLYGLNHATLKASAMEGDSESLPASSPTGDPAREECFSDPGLCGGGLTSPGEESFDSSVSLGKLEGKARYSGRTVGRLMLTRLKKLHQQATGSGKQGRVNNNVVESEASTSSSLLHTSGPKKPPRTFADSPKRSSTCARKEEPRAPNVVPSCPRREDLDGSDPSNGQIGWKVEQQAAHSRPKSHQVGWTVPAVTEAKNQSIPEQVYSMLHYSEDESRKQLIRKGNSKAVPQQKSTSTGGAKEIRTLANAAESKLGPRLYIDTVDGVGNAGHDEPKTPPHRRHSSSTDFERFARESNVKSTPHRREHRGGMQTSISSATTRRILEEFLNEERAAQHPAAVAHRGKLNVGERRRRTTGGIFERRRLQQENFLDDARRTNHEPRRKMRKSAPAAPVSSNRRTDEVVDGPILQRASSRSSVATAGKIAKRRTFRKAVPLLKHTRSIFEASKKKILAIKKFETPKKSNNALPVDEWDGPSMPPDPNINRHSSVKKKHALHHKHLGYTPDNLRCKSCCQSAQTEQLLDEERIAPSKRISNVHSVAPGPRRSRGNVDKENRFPANGSANGSGNRKSARSLNFASAPPPTRQREQQQQQQQQQRRRTASPDERSDEAEPSPSPPKVTKSLTDRKFMKSLRNLKISPRKFFRFASSADAAVSRQCTAGNSNEATTSHGLGEFHSFDDLNLDNVAHMGDFLNNIRQIVERPAAIGVERGSPGSHLASAIEGEPIYQEISPKKGNKMVLNEFISSETNKRYLMVNNDPNILYATVSKPTARGRATLPRSRSFTDVTVTGVSDPVETSTPVRKPLNNICKSQVKPTNRQRASFSPRTAIQHSSPQRSQDSSSRDSETSENDEEEDMENDASCLYRTAVTGSSYRSCGNDRRRRSTSSTSHTTRRSLFSPDKSFRSPRQETDDDHDISVLQQEQDRGAPVQQKKQLEEQVQESLIVRERAEERYSAIRLEHERFQKYPSDRLNRNGSSGMRRLCPRADSEQSFAFEKDIIVEVDYMGNTMCSDGGEGSSGGRKTTRKMAPIISFDTDGEIESLHRYQDQEISELVSSLHNNVTLSDIGTLETGSSVAAEEESVGYDTVDFVVPSCSHQQQQQQQQQHMSARLEGTGISVEIPKNDPRNLTVNTEDASKLISQVDNDSTYYTSNASPPMLGSPSSGKHSSSSASSGAAVMRNLKEKLRASFRKSKSFIKTERQRIAALIREERTGDNKYVSSSTCSSSSTSPRRQPQHSSRARDEADTDDTYRSLDPNDSQARNIAGSVTELTNRYMSKLMAQIQQQRDAQKQLKQAVAICRTTREFECSTELIEAERLLLLATLKETAARNVLNNIDYTANGMTLADRKRIGRVALNHFEFPLKRTALADTLFNYFYIVVCSYKNEVKATPAKERRTDGHVCFRDCEIEFLDLDADYEIRVEVFVLRLRKNVKNISFENRYHPDKDSKYAATCPSPSKLRRAGKMLSFRSSSPKNFDLDNELSRFKSQGYLTLTSSTLAAANVVDVAAEEETRTPSPLGQTIDGTYLTAVTNHTAETTTSSGLLGCEETTNNPYYSVSSNFQRMVRRQGNHNVFLVEDFKYLAFDSMAYSSNMTGTIGMSISSEVRFESSDVSGFLDVGSKVNERISWNRRWCKMNGFTMEFWNYPQECHEKQPILYIDLVRCVNERIELADRSICSRTRTMKIDISTSKAAGSGMSCSSSGIGSYRSTGGTSTTSPSSDRSNLTYHLLAADSQTELNRWMNELNRVVKFLKEWKI